MSGLVLCQQIHGTRAEQQFAVVSRCGDGRGGGRFRFAADRRYGVALAAAVAGRDDGRQRGVLGSLGGIVMMFQDVGDPGEKLPQQAIQRPTSQWSTPK